MPKRFAVIDLGTNTFHLLIAELDDKKLNQLYAEKIGVRLGKPGANAANQLEGISSGKIAPDAIERALNAMYGFLTRLAAYGILPSQVQAFGTSALRNASNGQEVASLIQKETGIFVEIIDGNREAALIYKGVSHSFPFSREPVLVMDIGGGRVEFIIADHHGPHWQQSFEIGGQRLMDRFMQEDPILPNQIVALEQWLDQELQPLWKFAAQYKVEVLLGSAGTFETLADMCFFKLHSEHMPFEDSTWEELPLITVYQLTNELALLNKTERLEVPGMIELRAGMSVVAILMLRYVLQKLKIKKLFASVYALKEGVFFSLAER
jgi:exopolyphosphatase/guanosine-5'-triphosphate,3'-diphosphate pyrophosphatase